MLRKVVAPMLAVLLALLAVSSAHLVGGQVDVDMNSADAQRVLRFAVAQYNSESSSVYTSQASKVISVQTQVVAGVKYIFTIEMARTSCKKGKSQPICTIHSDPAIAQPHICKLAVLTQIGKTSMMLIENTC